MEEKPEGKGSKFVNHLKQHKSSYAGILLDLVCCCWLLVWGHWVWPWEVDPGLPDWALPGDVFLFGPDAAAWANNAMAFVEGRYSELDYHRMPTWTLMTAAAIKLGGWDVALAGHFVDHLEHYLLPLVLYGLGRLGGARGAGLGAGMMAAINLPLLQSSRMFGVDTTITFMIPFAMLMAVLAARWWGLGVLSGLTTALLGASHFTAIPFLLPSSILLLLQGQGVKKRLAGLILHLGAGYLFLKELFKIFPLPNSNQLALTVQEGIQQGSTGGYHDPGWTQLKSMFSSGMDIAANDAIRLMVTAVRPDWVPWKFLLALPWIGVVGMFLRQRQEGEGKILAYVDWKLGLCLLLCLGPLPFLAMAHAPERYSYNMLPVVLLLCWRGVASVLALIDRLLKRAWKYWPSGLFCLALALYAGFKSREEAGPRLMPMPAPADAQAARAIGTALAALIPPGGGVAVVIREAAVHAGRSYCPNSTCPFGPSDYDMRRCIVVMEKECKGEGPLPYVVIEQESNSGLSEGRKLLDAWVQKRWSPAQTVSSFGFSGHIFLIDRTEAKALLKKP